MAGAMADTLDLHADDLISDMWSCQCWSDWSTDNSARVPSGQAGWCVVFDDLDALIASLELASDEALRIVDQAVATEKRRRALCDG